MAQTLKFAVGEKVATQLFMEVWGSTPESITRWIQKGYCTLSDLEAHPQDLNQQQILGVRYFTEFGKPLLETELKQIQLFLGKTFQDYNLRCEVSSSRNFQGALDIDLLHDYEVTNKTLPTALGLLTDCGFVSHVLATEFLGKPHRAIGVCVLSQSTGAGVHRPFSLNLVSKSENSGCTFQKKNLQALKRQRSCESAEQIFAGLCIYLLERGIGSVQRRILQTNIKRRGFVLL